MFCCNKQASRRLFFAKKIPELRVAQILGGLLLKLSLGSGLGGWPIQPQHILGALDRSANGIGELGCYRVCETSLPFDAFRHLELIGQRSQNVLHPVFQLDLSRRSADGRRWRAGGWRTNGLNGRRRRRRWGRSSRSRGSRCRVAEGEGIVFLTLDYAPVLECSREWTVASGVAMEAEFLVHGNREVCTLEIRQLGAEGGDDIHDCSPVSLNVEGLLVFVCHGVVSFCWGFVRIQIWTRAFYRWWWRWRWRWRWWRWWWRWRSFRFLPQKHCRDFFVGASDQDYKLCAPCTKNPNYEITRVTFIWTDNQATGFQSWISCWFWVSSDLVDVKRHVRYVFARASQSTFNSQLDHSSFISRRRWSTKIAPSSVSNIKTVILAVHVLLLVVGLYEKNWR